MTQALGMAFPGMAPRPSMHDLPTLAVDSSSSSTAGAATAPPLADLSGLSSGSGRGLDQAIAAAELAVEEEDDPSSAV